MITKSKKWTCICIILFQIDLKYRWEYDFLASSSGHVLLCFLYNYGLSLYSCKTKLTLSSIDCFWSWYFSTATKE